MMFRLALAALVVAVATPAVAQPKPEKLDPRCEKVLPAAAAEKITGLAGLKLVGRFHLPTAGGTCNYLVGDKDLVLLVTIDDEGGSDKSWSRRYADAPLHRMKKPVPGVGKEAFLSMGGVYARVGEAAITFGTYMKPKSMVQYVPEAKLVELAKEVASKL